jgi:thiol-disulfide isomerase/thioredoxin
LIIDNYQHFSNYKIIGVKFIFIIILLNFSCKRKDVKYSVIEGSIDSLRSNKLYIVNAAEFEKPLDSFKVFEGKFEYKKFWKKDEEPFLASLSFRDSVTGKLKTLEFLNPILSNLIKGSPIFVTDAFVLGKEKIFINGKVTNRPHFEKADSIMLTGSNQTNAYFETQMSDFGFINASTQKDNLIKTFKDLIKKYPYSYYYLHSLINNENSYSNKELTTFLNLFDNHLRLSPSGKSLAVFMKTRDMANSNSLNFVAYDPENNLREVIDTSYRLNVLSFWASWCGPCMDEITMYKKLYPLFKAKNIKLSAVSIDVNKKNYKDALSRLKMKWNQYRVNERKIDDTKNKFRFSYIPTSIFFDNKGKEIFRLSGYDSTAGKMILKAIVPYLK